MLLRHLRRVTMRFSKEKDEEKMASAHNNGQEYLLFPTKFPIFPYYFYMTKINKYLYEYINHNRIKYVSAFPLRPGVAKKEFQPLSWYHLEKQMGLKLKPKAEVTEPQKEEDFEIANNNTIFDDPIYKAGSSIYYIDHISQIFPIGSLCKIVTSSRNNEYLAFLRSEVRLEIDPQEYKHMESPIMFLSGKVLKNGNPFQVVSEHGTLVNLYNRIANISVVNLPTVINSPILKTIQLMSGYLCTLAYFTPLQLYTIFKTINLVERTKILIEYYEDYVKFFEEQWKQHSSQNVDLDEDKQKEKIQQIYEDFQDKLGFKTDVEYIKKIKKKLQSGRYPETIAKLIHCEIQNMQELGEGNPEINRKKHFINLLVDYPFGILAKEDFDIQKAKKILDEDHYGMKKVKQRILEFIAVSKIKGEFKSKVLLLHGPPGVGKTSIVKSIAKCLNRPYGRISLGGQYDTAIIKGHRKTYIGAYPGKIYDTIFKAKAENPVILLDEIDKIQARSGGASLQDVVMEVLDPVQNFKFKDDFMDIEVDLSKVLFVCTANSLETIFPPLLDRLERIQVSGYTTEQKKQIFSRYIINESMNNAGLPEEVQKKIDFTESGIHGMIEGHCKEAGVRNLVRKTNKIFNKMALEYVKKADFDYEITNSTLRKYLGLPKFRDSRLYAQVPPKGVMIGLAYNAYGGSIMYIEAAASNIRKLPLSKESSEEKKSPQPELPKGSLMLTGNIHDVMKESCQLAYSYAKYITSTFFNNHYLEVNDIHLNFPEIEIGKDGPSAGAAITCTLVSLALGKPAHKEIAMTGEITLSGNVSAIGGVKEKTMGAKREGINELIFPEENRRDVEELEEEIRKGMTFHFASNFFEVMELVFGIKISEGLERQESSS